MIAPSSSGAHPACHRSSAGPIRLLLIHPRMPESFWSLRWWVRDISRKDALNPPLGLATLAALCPPEWEVTILDENIEPLPLEPAADIVAVGGMGVQFEQQTRLLRHYRAAGYYVVAGGSGASLCPEQFSALACTVIAGEAEYIWPQFCVDYARGEPRAMYREQGSVDLEHSPCPRFDLLKLERYAVAALQFSRGCPFRCEFCDVIVMFGRKPRHKSLRQVEQELEALRHRNVRSVFFVDDNLIGNPRVAKELLRFLADYQRRHSYPFEFGSQVSVNIAEKTELLELGAAAGFSWLFVGIETPDRATLEQLGKSQNARVDLLSAVQRIHNHGIEVLAGFIVGFDADDESTFDRQLDFIARSGIQVAMVGLLTALPNTPLFERLSAAGRLRGTELFDNTKLETNIVPAKMSYAALISGYQRLYERLTSDRVIAQRVRNKLRHWRARPGSVLRSDVPRRRVLRMLALEVLRGGAGRLWHFAISLLGSRSTSLSVAVSDWIAALSMRDYWERHIRVCDVEDIRRRYLAMCDALAGFRREIALTLTRCTASMASISIVIKGRMEPAARRMLARRLEQLLRRSRVTLSLRIEGLRGIDLRQLERLLEQLARYRERIVVESDGYACASI